MRLRHKFGLLACIYIGSLLCNFILCTACIMAYHELLLKAFGTPPTVVDSVRARRPDGALSPLGVEAEDSEATSPAAAGPRPDTDGELGSWTAVVLSANAFIGMLLGILGIYLVRGWVTRPIVALREATHQIGRGNWALRIPSRSSDEFGMLAHDVNRMAEALATLQDDLNRRQRQLTTADALRCVIHNIRSPLTGIRWLAEVLMPRLGTDNEAVSKEQRIIAIVDDIIQKLNESRAVYVQTAVGTESAAPRGQSVNSPAAVPESPSPGGMHG